jgi:hypothetical protein
VFAYSVRSPEGKIVICDGNSGVTLGTVSESEIILEAVWAPDAAFVYLSKDQRGDFLASFYPGFIWHDEPIAKLERIEPKDGSPMANFTFINDGVGYTYLSRSARLDMIVIQSNLSSEPVKLT